MVEYGLKRTEVSKVIVINVLLLRKLSMFGLISR
jgi:hypothetical protein